MPSHIDVLMRVSLPCDAANAASRRGEGRGALVREHERAGAQQVSGVEPVLHAALAGERAIRRSASASARPASRRYKRICADESLREAEAVRLRRVTDGHELETPW